LLRNCCVGIGTQKPIVKLHVYSAIDEYPNELPVFRLESYDHNESNAWDFSNNRQNLEIKYGSTHEEQVQETKTLFVFNEKAMIGVGTDNPQANIHILNSETQSANIIFEAPKNASANAPSTFLEIENKRGKVGLFYYDDQTDKFSILKYNNNNQKLSFFENVTITPEGTVEAVKFIGDGSELTGIEASDIWEISQNGNDIFYNGGYVGIGKSSPEKTLDLSGFEPTIRFNSKYELISPAPDATTNTVVDKWDIRMIENSLNFDYTFNNTTTSESLLKLDVTNGSFKMNIAGRVDAQQYFQNGEPFVTSQWLSNGNDIYYNGGNVGIGTENPTAPLHIYGTNPDIFLDVNTSTAGGYNPQLSFAEDGIEKALFYYERGENNLVLKNNSISAVVIDEQGNVGIGTDYIPTGYKLSVDGKIICEKIKVVSDVNGADFVFDENYNLMPIEDVESFIIENKHLPNVPTANEMKTNGFDLIEMDIILLQKIEELTLYIIEQNKIIQKQQEEIEKLKNNQ